MAQIGGPFAAWSHEGPAPPEGRPGLVSAVVAAGAVVLLLAAAWLVQSSGDATADVDWTDPGAVGTTFIERYAVHDPAACQLTTSALRDRLEREGRCAGPVRGPSPQLAVLGSHTCGGIHHFDALVTPEGEFGKRFVSVGLERASEKSWLVRSVLAIGDCRVLVTRTCDGGR